MRLSAASGLFLAFAAWLAVGCASAPQLEMYPRREIDRPLTLPDGVATWQIPSIFIHERYPDGRESTFPPIPLPVVWESSLSDDWTLFGGPLPLGITHQLWNTERGRLGARLLVGIGYGSATGFVLMPNLTVPYRHKFSKNFAVDLEGTVGSTLYAKGGEWSRLDWRVAVGPLFQVTDELAVSPVVHLSSWEFQNNSGFREISSLESGVAAGLGASAVWSLSRRWDLRPSYTYSTRSSVNPSYRHMGILNFVYFW